MEMVLRVVGVLGIGLGIWIGFETAQNLSRMGVSLSNPMALTAWAGAATFIVGGILVLGFGTAIEVLKQIRDNQKRSN